MGFPSIKYFKTVALCACHSRKIVEGFECPGCMSLVCQLPQECPICSLTLVSVSSLERSYHHLFPPEKFTQIDGMRKCEFCEKDGADVKCEGCKSVACRECEGFIYEVLHSCPGCVPS
jgi:transcription initiation factor TFIIH subunit 2